MSNLDRLLSENTKLQVEVAQLKSEIAFLRTHPVTDQGKRGEIVACAITGGKLTQFNAAHDVTIEGGAKIEVKFSKLQTPNKDIPTFHRWSWSKLLGWRDYKTGKDYDFLLLMGDKDPYFLSQYPADGSPYMFFLIPWSNVSEILSKGGVSGSQAQLNTDLRTARSRRSRAIKKYMVSSMQVSDVVRLQIKRGDDGNPEISWRNGTNVQLVFDGFIGEGTL